MLQKLVPVLVGLGILTISGLLFYYYRRRLHTRYGPIPVLGRVSPNPSTSPTISTTRASLRRAWTHARLQGPRKFGGLFPNIKTVRSRDRLQAWAIDVDADASPEHAPDDPDNWRHSTASLVASMPQQTHAPDVISLPDPLPMIQDAEPARRLGRPTRGVIKDRDAQLPIAQVVNAPPRSGFKIDDLDSVSSPGAASARHGAQLGAIAFGQSRAEEERWHVVGENGSLEESSQNGSVLLIGRGTFSISSHTTEEGPERSGSLPHRPSPLRDPLHLVIPPSEGSAPPPMVIHNPRPMRAAEFPLQSPPRLGVPVEYNRPLTAPAMQPVPPMPETPPPSHSGTQKANLYHPSVLPYAQRSQPNLSLVASGAMPPKWPSSGRVEPAHDSHGRGPQPRGSLVALSVESSEREYTVPNPFTRDFSVQKQRVSWPARRESDTILLE